MTKKYVLRKSSKAQIVLEEKDLLTWAKWMEKDENRRVDLTEKDGVRVSTVFLGLNMNFFGGRNLFFETMVFGGKYGDYIRRYATYKQALAGHKAVVKKVMKKSKSKK